jgi:ParB family transcriptional regulator, chromosome partitioning protein
VRFIADEGIYYVIAGERRYRAAKEAGLTELPCWVQRPEERDVLVHQIVENWQRAELHPFDLADALTELRDTNGYSQADIARLTGKPESEISRLLSLLKLEPQVQKESRADVSGEITRRHLITISTLNPSAQQRVFRLVKEKGMTALETERFVQDTKAKAVPVDRRGAHHAERIRFKTEKALVLVQFRRGTVTKDDILAALDEARQQAAKHHAQDATT